MRDPARRRALPGGADGWWPRSEDTTEPERPASTGVGGGYVIRRANGTVGWAFNVPAIDQRRVWLLADGAGEWVR